MTLKEYLDAVATGMILAIAVMKDHPDFNKFRDEHTAMIKKLRTQK